MGDPLLLAEMAVMLLVIGAFAGVLAGLLGVGGGIVLVPAFYYAFERLGFGSDYLMQVCLATSLATIIVTSQRSMRSHHKRGAVDWALLRDWGPGIAAGALAGVFLAAALKTRELQYIFGVLASVIGLYMAFGKAEWRLGDRMPMGLKGYLISPVIGFLSVLMGIGGGSFGVPTMTLFGVPIHRAVGTATGFGMLIAVPSVAVFLFSGIPADVRPPYTIGAVNLPAFALAIAMSMLTAPWGAELAHKTDAKRLKRIFGGFLFIVALNMLRKAAGF